MTTKTNTHTDWNLLKLGTVISLEYGKPLLNSKRKLDGKYPVYGANGEKMRTDEYYYDKKSIIVGRKGSAGELNLTTERFWPLDVTYYVTFENKKCNLMFLYELLHTLKLPKLATGVKPGLNRNEVYSIEVKIPALPEQKCIVEVLETWDEYIEKLEKIIRLKKKTKKYLMQKLLSRKLRPNNFSGEWEYIRLSNIAKTSSGGTPKSTNEKYYQNGKIPWLKSGEIRKGRINFFKNYITEEGLKNSSAKLFPMSTILIAMYGVTAGQIGFLQKEAATNQAICGILPNSKYDSTYLYYFFLTQTDKLLKMGSGAAQPNISQEIIKDYDVFIPESIPEQTAIAAILTTADKEIEALEKKKALVEQQKKFLLNNLITGKIRLPEFTK